MQNKKTKMKEIHAQGMIKKKKRKKGRISHVQNKEGKGERCDYTKRRPNKSDGNN
jgi:hypothetical protein